MKILICVVIISLAWVTMSGTILKVAQDGTQLYPTIQRAINASAHTDTVLVYPGRYMENVRFYGKNITLASLEMITGQRRYMHTTIIDANKSGPGIIITNGESNVTIRGFTITNGSGIYSESYDISSGGGLYIAHLSGQRNVKIFNCQISDNQADMGGGARVSRCNLTLSGVSITRNRAGRGGGLYYEGVSQSDYTTTFDQFNRCNLYNNYAAAGSDLFYANAYEYFHVIVDTFTVANAWDFFASVDITYPPATSPFTFDILHTVFDVVNHDLYVATWGDDSNSGLSADQPLRNVFLAMRRIASDSENPKTVHVANGVYSFTQNGQIFPLTVKSFTALKGESQEGTVFDAEAASHLLILPSYSQYPVISDLTLSNGKSGIASMRAENLKVENVTVRNITHNQSTSGIACFENTGYDLLKNVKVENVTLVSSYAPAIYFYRKSGRVELINVDISDCIYPQTEPTLHIYANEDCEVLLDSCKLHDITNISYQGQNPVLRIDYDQGYATRLKVDIRNSVFYNNSHLYGGAVGVVYSLNDTIKVSNCTFAGNTNYYNTLSLLGTSILTNNNFWAPSVSTQVFINSHSGNPSITTTFNHNNISHGINGVLNYTHTNPLIWGEGNTNEDPLFTMQGNNPYTLGADSPLIDTGWQNSSGLAEPGLDAGGNERLWDGDGDGYSVIDKGAYEYQMLYAPANLNAVVSGVNVWLDWAMPITERSLTGYRIYRNGNIRADINDPGLMAFRDNIAQTDTIIYAVVALYGEVESAPSNEVSVVVEVGNDDDVNIPEVDYLLVTPNPFSAFAVLRLGLVKSSEIDLGIFNLRGQKVTNISQGRLDKGEHVLFWDGRDEKGYPCSNAVYVLRLTINGKQVNTRKVTLIK